MSASSPPRSRSLALALALVALACSGPSGERGQTLQVFTDWIRIDASCGDYSFRAPPDTVEQAAQGVDSCREKWTTSSCDYAADYGPFSSDLSEYRDALEYEELQELISGREAKLVTATLAEPAQGEPPYVAGVTLAEVEPNAAGIRLTLDARCRSSAGQLDALSVFRTIVLLE